MSKVINIHEAKTHLSRIIDEVAAGDEVIIAKAGKPMARLSALQPPKQRRVLGILEGKLHLPEDIDAPLPEDVAATFEEC